MACHSVLWYDNTSYFKLKDKWKNNGNKLSDFDEMLQRKWNAAMKKGAFRYTLLGCQHKELNLFDDGGIIGTTSQKFNCLAVLNVQRGVNRRKKDLVDSMNAEFDANKFNFNKIKNEEILFEIKNKLDVDNEIKHLIIINVSPIDYCHILFVSNREKCMAQRMTEVSLHKAIEVLKLSSQPGFRIGFNSMHAWASVNHQHFHGMYVSKPLFVDYIEAETHIAGHCYMIEKLLPHQGFIFPINDDDDTEKVVQDVVTTTNTLHYLEKPYNFVITRHATNDSIHIALWPRKSSNNSLNPTSFLNIACVELGGLFLFTSKDIYDKYTSKDIRNELQAVQFDEKTFESIVKEVQTNILSKHK